MRKYDAVIIGSGPNGLAAGIEMSRQGLQVLILEAQETIGGGMRSGSYTLPGFIHDHCSAVHPAGYLSPYFKTLPLTDFGLEWIHPEISVAHPLENEPAAMLYQSIEKTSAELGLDDENWKNSFSYFVEHGENLLRDGMGPLQFPKNPFLLANFGIKGLQSAQNFVQKNLATNRAKALFAGCAGHSILPLSKRLTAAVGMMFVIQGHLATWPVVKGGTENLAVALKNYFLKLGGEIQTSFRVENFGQLPEASCYLFDTSPAQLIKIAQDQLPNSYTKKLKNYRYGPGIFKLDWALSGSIPWKDPNCEKASTVHVGGTFAEIARSEATVWKGQHADEPFLILCQQSEIDRSRAPRASHTGYAYCHVPQGSSLDQTAAIENQIERFAPGFKDLILARKSTNCKEFENDNPNYLGGAITGGVADLKQFFFRPAIKLDPYSTPNKKIFICSAATPPGGGVHGMCGYYAARSALKKVFGKKASTI